MYREIAPEIKINVGNLFNQSTQGAQSLTALKQWDRWDSIFKDNLQNQMRPGYDMQGKLMRIKNIKIFGSFGFNEVCPTITRNNPYPVDSSISSISDRLYDVAYLRIVIAQLKKGGASFPQKITQDINNDPNVQETVQDLSLINGPLVENVTASFNILKNKVIKIDNNNPYRSFTINLKNPFTYRLNADTGNHFDANDIIIFTQYVCPRVLQIVHTQTTPSTYSYIGPKSMCQMNFKVSFVDQD